MNRIVGINYTSIALVLLVAVAGIGFLNTYRAQEISAALEADLAAARETILVLQEENSNLSEKLAQAQERYAEEKSELEAELARMTRLYEVVNRRDAYAAEKVVYLTFDDGPSAQVTDDILDILDYYGIKATFFVIGYKALNNPEVVKRIHAAGHAIGNHTYSHDYGSIYRNLDTFSADFHEAQEAIYSVIGEYPRLYRYAGGSLTARNYAGRSSRAEFDQYLWQHGVQFFDWNVDSGDASTGTVTVDSIIVRTLSQVRNRQKVIILMHDYRFRQTTAEALPTIIETLLERGYEFAPLTPTGYTAQHSN